MITSSTYHEHLAVSIDEYDDNIELSINGLKKLGFKSFSILTIGNKTASHLPDETLLKIRNYVGNHLVKNIKLDLGYTKVPSEKDIEKELAVAGFFKSQHIILGCSALAFRDEQAFLNYLDIVTNKAISMSLIPLLDIGHDAFVHDPERFSQILLKHKKIRFLYDPSRFMERSRTYPLTKWWNVLNSYCSGLLLRDFKTGLGYFPLGHGSTEIGDSFIQFIDRGGKNIIFKPSLGRRYGSIIGKSNTFALALDILKEFLLDKERKNV